MAHLHAAVALRASILMCLGPQAASGACRVPSMLARMQQSAKHAQWEDLLPWLALLNVHLVVWAAINPTQVLQSASLVLLGTSVQGTLRLKNVEHVLQGALLPPREALCAECVGQAALDSPVA